MQMGGNFLQQYTARLGSFSFDAGKRFLHARRAKWRASSRFSMNFLHPALRMLVGTSRRLIVGIAAIRPTREKCVVNRRQIAPLGVALLAAFFVAACAMSPNGDARSAEGRRELVAKRAIERWNALINGDFAAAYAYLSPASRAGVTLERFEGNLRKDSYRNAEIDHVDCTEIACSVKLWITFDHPLIQGLRSPVEESWVFDGGQAWYVYRG
jgi:hypothetical protein